ncbi:MAG: hypothetical protein E5V62_12405 [Mesorhizobium sp.]|nr:MAG: hypothetical protein E5V62_12405 [Mesorhizobium sp.]
MGGDQLSCRLSPIAKAARMSGAPKPPISPLEGEMSGRTEGGAVPPACPTILPSQFPSNTGFSFATNAL